MLFSTKDLPTRPARVAPQAQASQPMTTDLVATLGGSLSELKQSVAEIAPDRYIHFVTAGKWSSHQLLRYLIEQTGAVHLRMCTWSMTEDLCRALLQLRNKGLLLSAECVLSERINERTPTVFQLAKNTFDKIKLAKLHAKVMVLYNDAWNVTIVGSANLTRNPKMEAGVIDSHKAIADFHLKWLQDELDKVE
jgi:hypothetical protein